MPCKQLFFASVVLFVLLSVPLINYVGASSEMWNQVYGWAGADFAHSLVETSDGGFALAGVTDSFGAGGNDFWLIKTDSFGNVEWNQTYGGTDSSIAYSLVETFDGGFALAGSSGSPLYFPIGSGTTDFWLVKTDAYGNMEWNQTYGGTGDEVAYSLVETSDGGFALAGEQSRNFWLVKTDAYGNTEWNQTYGEAKYNHAYSVVEPADGGFVLASTNFQLIKTDAHGTVEWNWTYGREDYDTVYSLVETFDGGFALAGETYSFDDANGFWLVKTDANGNLEWNQTYRRTEYDRPYSLIQTSDGGYALAGETINLGSTYLWVVKTNENGIIPEFPSWIILPLFLTVTLVVAIYRKKLSKTSNQHSY